MAVFEHTPLMTYVDEGGGRHLLYPITRQECVDGLEEALQSKAGLVQPVTVSVPLSWSGSGPWTQTISVAGVTAADEHLGIFPAPVADAAARKLQYAAYGCLSPADCETVAGGIKLVCGEKKPSVAFQVVVKGVR